MKTPSLLFAIPALAEINPLVAFPRGPHPVGLHSQYTVAGSDEIINLFVPYHDSPTIHSFEINTNFTPTAHYQRVDDRSLVPRDVCTFITDCAGQAYSSADVFAAAAAQITDEDCNTVAMAVTTYLTQDDYAGAMNIIQGNVVGISVNLASSAPNYFINARLEATYGNSDTRNDACGEQNPETFTTNAAGAVYEFCVSLQTESAEQATANFDVLDTHGGVDTPTGGFEGRAKMFVSEQAATWGDVCSNDYGVDW